MQKTSLGGFTPADLQRILCEDLKMFLGDTNLKCTNGDYRPINVYCQDLPIQQSNDDEDDLDMAPYIIVRVLDGDKKGTDTLRVNIGLIIAVYDDDFNRSGHTDVLNIISRIESHFGKKPCIGNFRAYEDFEFVLQNEDTHPFYFGGVKLSFHAPKTRQEDDFYT